MNKRTLPHNKVSKILIGACALLAPALAVQSQTETNSTSLNKITPSVSQNINKTSDALVAYKILVSDDALARKIAISFHHAVLETNYQDDYIIADLTTKEIAQLKKQGLQIETATEWNAEYKQFQQNIAHRLQQKSQGILMDGIPGFECYATVEETLDEGAQFVVDYPNLAEWIDIGDSWNKANNQGGYDLMVLKLTNQSIVENKPKLFVHSSMHAREYTPAALTLDFAKELLIEYENNVDIQWILDYHEVHILFHMNPDGRKIAETGVLQRKNTNQNHCPGLNVGVDLNRNFAYFWNSTSNGSSGFECDSTYRGSAPESEPETQAVSNYIRSIFPDVRGDNINDAAPTDTAGMHLDIHSYSELVLWPWGHTSALSPNDDGFVSLGNKLAWFNNYTPQQSIGLYPTDGTSDDVSYGELGIAAFTFELGTSFFQQCTDYQDTIRPDNLPALIYAAKVSAAPYLLAHGPEVTQIELAGSNTGTSVPSGTPVELVVTADATRTQLSTNGNTISKVEYSIDTPVWKETATVIEVLGNDGDLSDGVELFDAQIDTSGLSNGDHVIYVRAYDEAGNVGVPTANKLTISDNQLPVAEFTTNCNELVCNFDAAASNDPDGTISSYDWDFGDGQISTLQNPSHTYAEDGSYTVSLTVTDNDGGFSSTTETFVVEQTPTNTTGGFTETGLSPSRGENLSYTIEVPANASLLEVSISGGSGNADLVLNYGSAPTRTDNDCIVQGAGNDHSCTITDPQQGIWYIIVRGVQASSGIQLDAFWTAETTDNVSPTAGFNVNVDALQATFTDSSNDSDGTITSRNWDFGDGNTSTETNPIHNYAVAGTYTVQLTVSDDQGASDATSQSVTVSDSNTPPSASFSVTSNELAATFTDLSSDSDGSISSHNWDFGDGNNSTAASPMHTYASAGTYSVSLTVTDNDGATDTETQSVTVTEAGGNSGGFTETGLSPARGENLSYTIDVPAGATSLVIDTSSGTGNVDLVINFGAAPTRTNNDCIQQGAGNTHNCTISNPDEGTWFIIVRGTAASSGAQLDAYWFD
jgi:carboxypeptidase T